MLLMLLLTLLMMMIIFFKGLDCRCISFEIMDFLEIILYIHICICWIICTVDV